MILLSSLINHHLHRNRQDFDTKEHSLSSGKDDHLSGHNHSKGTFSPLHCHHLQKLNINYFDYLAHSDALINAVA